MDVCPGAMPVWAAYKIDHPHPALLRWPGIFCGVYKNGLHCKINDLAAMLSDAGEGVLFVCDPYQ